MTRPRTTLYLTSVLLTLAAITVAPTLAIASATWYTTDSYFTATIKPGAPSSIPETWIPMGDTFNGDGSGPSACSTGWNGGNMGNAYDTSSEASTAAGPSGWSNNNLGGTVNIACAASATWPCCQHGTPAANKPGPFSSPSDQSTWTALQLNGGVDKMYSAPWTATNWELCEWFAVPNTQGAIVMATAMDSKGVPANDALVLATGTIGNLVLYQYNDQNSQAVSETYPENGSWTFACLNWTTSTLTASIVGFNGTTTHSANFHTTPTYTSSGLSSVNSTTAWAAGDLWLWGMSFATCNACLNYEWTSPTNPASGGGGSVGNPVAGTGTSGCSQTGIISGEPKFQWCGPNLNCNAIDLSWTNLGNDFGWLGCIIEQGLITVVSSIANVFIDLVVPSTTVLEADWTGFSDTLNSHVPTNYIYGGITGVDSAFDGAHGSPSLDLALPPPWSTTIHITWSEILGPFSSWRPLFASLVYLTFAIPVAVEARRTFEN